MGKEIPAFQRVLVRGREKSRCCRCGSPVTVGQWHHRRTRSVVDDHRHCSCNGVWLCATCHAWVHSQPFLARQTGFIVSRHVAEPGAVPITTPWGVRLHDCVGGITYETGATDEQERRGGGGGEAPR